MSSALSVRARLTLWHSGLLAALMVAFVLAAYTLLHRTELGRVDALLHEQSEIVEQAMRTAGARTASRQPADTVRLVNVLHDLRARGLRAWIFDGERRLVASTALVREGEGDAEERMVLGDTVATADLLTAIDSAARTSGLSTVHTGAGDARLYVTPLPPDLGSGSILVSQSLEAVQALFADARNAAIVAILLAVALSVVAGYLLARRSLSPVTEMSRRAERIGAANLHERLPVANVSDELGVLASTFNALLDRVSGAFEQQRRFMADASHELRTPVAIMRGEADVALAGPDRSAAEYRDAVGIMGDAAARLSRTVNDVFLLARVDAGQVPPTPSSLYFGELVADTCRAMRSLAAARGIEVVVESAGDVPYVGDEDLLGRLVMNLVDNAIKYSPDGGLVRVAVATPADGTITLRVTNGGGGIPVESQPFVFDRFYRADPARSRDLLSRGSGSGLGLSIARWIAHAHGGRLDLAESSLDRTVFTLTLPREPTIGP